MNLSYVVSALMMILAGCVAPECDGSDCTSAAGPSDALWSDGDGGNAGPISRTVRPLISVDETGTVIVCSVVLISRNVALESNCLVAPDTRYFVAEPTTDPVVVQPLGELIETVGNPHGRGTNDRLFIFDRTVAPQLTDRAALTDMELPEPTDTLIAGFEFGTRAASFSHPATSQSILVGGGEALYYRSELNVNTDSVFLFTAGGALLGHGTAFDGHALFVQLGQYRDWIDETVRAAAERVDATTPRASSVLLVER